MSAALAMSEAKRLKACMEARGVKCSIELQAGRPYADPWYSKKFLRMHHHTVSKPSQGNTPCLALVKRGRSDVPGPLCNGYGGFDRVYRIITMGLANHPGKGGPITIDGVTMPKDSARIASWGTEWEGGIEKWSPAMLEFMARADLALADWMNRPVTSQLEHKTWAPGRKPDRLGMTRASAITLSQKWAAVSKPGGSTKPPENNEEDTMAGLTKADLVSAFKEALSSERPSLDARQTFDNDHDEQVLAWQVTGQVLAERRMDELHSTGMPYTQAAAQVRVEVQTFMRDLWTQ